MLTLAKALNKGGSLNDYANYKIEQNEEKELCNELRLYICRNYWYLTGEFFEIEGLLGWSRGFGKDGDYSIHRKHGRQFGLKALETLLTELSHTEKDDSIERVLAMSENKESNAMEINFVNFFGTLTDYIGSGAAFSLYDHIAENMSEYEMGAARPFLYLDDDEYKLTCAGLIMIITRGNSKNNARRKFFKAQTKGKILNLK